ncbi:MAG TPA: methylmalonyl-CoA mutase family protein [Candidatus Binataceae bacterium]|nr:methylmalonyl-CoA mutase family protein [Candidatus Binataceae bacterium]
MAKELEIERERAGSGGADTIRNGGVDDAFAAAERQWRERVARRDIPPAKTSSGLELDILYTPQSLRDNDPLNDIGLPGEYPFTRGVQPTMHRGRLWTMRQYSGFATPKESNQRYRWLLEQGQTGISVALDLPTQLGLDSDDPEAADDVGRVGVAVDTLADMEILFEGIPLDRISTSFTINSTASILLAMYLAVAERQGVPPDKITGTTQNDILKEYVSRGTWIFPPEPSLRLIVDTIEHCFTHAPRFNPISVAGAHFHDAGATVVQDLAYTLADGLTYVQRCIDRGLKVDDFAPLISFFFYTHNDFFEEIAKYRAGRRLWARLMKERFGARDPRAQMFRFGVVCGGSTLTAQQPQNNIVRVAYQALASVLGGVQSMFTAAWDEPFAIPTEQTAEIALRTQQVLAYETGVSNVADPLGGSYYVEALTDKVERETRTIIERIESLGGMVACIQNGFIQKEIAVEAYRFQKRVENAEQVVVGVNRFARPEPERRLELYQSDNAAADRQRESLARVRATRDNSRVKTALSKLREVARGKDNMMPAISEAVKAYASVGEICGVLRSEFGTFKEPVGL